MGVQLLLDPMNASSMVTGQFQVCLFAVCPVIPKFFLDLRVSPLILKNMLAVMTAIPLLASLITIFSSVIGTAFWTFFLSFLSFKLKICLF